ncbi:MAG: hypothetical protein HY727_12065 [Candidatus Rokubacteria bacterium]|nr:hypothetical protein [Candidatus Rokubacteria bacterium]
MDLERFFARVIRASFGDLGLSDEAVVAYLANLLTRFARTENLYPRGVREVRLETIADLLLEIQGAWQLSSPYFEPEREVTLRRHIGDYTLFMTGLFPERVERMASTRHYIAQGKRAYHFVSEHARVSGRAAAPPYRRLAERFESYVGVLDYARRVHFADHPEHPFFRLGFA